MRFRSSNFGPSVSWLASRLVVVLAFFALSASSLCAATVVRSIQSGTVTLTTTGTTTVTINSVTMANAFLVFGTQANDIHERTYGVAGNITTATTIAFTRAAADSNVTIQWYVIEFSSGVTVQRGSATIANGTNTTNVTLGAAVTLANSFPIISTSRNGSANSLNVSDEVQATLTSTTNLALTTGANVSSAVTVQWQVISYTGASVQTGTATLAGGNAGAEALSTTATLGTSITPSNSWLIYTFQEAATVEQDASAVTARGQITNGTTLTFDRYAVTGGGNAGALTFRYYVVSFTDGTTVQQGTQNFTSAGPTTDAVNNVPITPGVCQIPVGGGEQLQSGRSDHSGDTNLGVDIFTFSLVPGASFLQITRLNATDNADVPWWVIQFTSCTNPQISQSTGVLSVGAGSTVTVSVANGASAASGLTINDLLLPNWQIGIAYTVGQYVVYDGGVYQVKTAHTSAAGSEPSVSGNWTAVAQWQPGVTYAVNALVIFDSNIYKCIVAHTSTSVPSNEPPNNTTDWTVQTPTMPADFTVSGPAISGATAGTCATVNGGLGIQCTGVSIAANTTATLTYTLTPSVADDVTSFATVTGSTGATGTVALGTNLPGTSTYLIPVEATAGGFCLSPAPAVASSTLSGIVNTYYPGVGKADAGATSISVGTAAGASTAIASGDLLLVIQMQNASFNSTNGITYGDGQSGAGVTAQNNVGQYEFVQATSAVSGGVVSIKGAGKGNGLVHSYLTAAATATTGQYTFQVIRVPSYQNVSLAGTTTALNWNGSVGGVVALDVAGTLTFNSGANIDVSGQGFRGAVGLQLQGNDGAVFNTAAYTDFAFVAPTGDTAPNLPIPGVHASKGEGIAGTPHYTIVTQNTAPNVAIIGGQDTGVEGYPNGSMGRGGPGNAGGGGSDHDPETASPGGNDENSGGGGGGNGGAGGRGGDTWNTTKMLGGLGGAAFTPSVDAIVLGGGGGAGTRNNNDGLVVSAGGASGGGIVILRTGAISGVATINANGLDDNEITLNDGGGGGGAAGSVVVLSQSGFSSGSLTVNAKGGKGGTAWLNDTNGNPEALGTCNSTAPPAAGNNAGFDANGNPLQSGVEGGACNTHGPGGGGGGGVVITTGNLASGTTVGVNGGAPGITTSATSPTILLDATSGAAGVYTTVATSPVGVSATAACVDWAITQTDIGGGNSNGIVGQFNTGFPVSYSITVSDGATAGAGTVTVTEPLPAGLSAFGTGSNGASAPSGTGWNCSASTATTLSCTRSDALAANSNYPVITVPVVNVTAATNTTITATATLNVAGSNVATATDKDNVVNPLVKKDSGGGSSGNGMTGTSATGALYANFGSQYYTLTVTNSTAAAFAIGTTVTDPAPSGMTFGTGANAPSGTGWNCSASTASNVSCTSTAAIAAGASSSITVVINGFTTTIGGNISNTASLVISGSTTACTGGTPCTATDTATVKAGFYEKIVDSGSGSGDSLGAQTTGNFAHNSPAQYVITVTNLANVIAPGSVTVTLPTTAANITLGTPTGSGWTCTKAGTTTVTVTCTRTAGDVLAANASYPSIDIPITNVGAAACTACVSSTATLTAGATGNISITATDTDNVKAAGAIAITKNQSFQGGGCCGPNPMNVNQGNYVDYYIVATNTSGATQTNVVISDSLDPSLVFASIATASSNGATITCTAPPANVSGGGNISCTIASMPNGGTATLTVAVQVGIPPQNNPISNYANVSYTGGTTTAGPVTLNVTYPNQPTSVDLLSLRAYEDGAAALIHWSTSHETRNLGFNVYREDANGERVKLNTSLIAGAALKFRNARASELRTYLWRDNTTPVEGVRYYVEDVETGGRRTMHGPVEVDLVELPAEIASVSTTQHAPTLHELNLAASSGRGSVHEYRPAAGFVVVNTAVSNATDATDATGGNDTASQDVDFPEMIVTASGRRMLGRSPAHLPAFRIRPTTSPQTVQFELASGPAVKISVTEEGWYEIPQAVLMAAGLDPSKDPRLIRLFAEGVEQPIQVVSNGPAHFGFGPQDSVEFYGTGLDLPSTGTRVYWLTQDLGLGRRMGFESGQGYFERGALTSSPYTLSWDDETTYLAALTNAPQGNFFGEVIASVPVQQTFNVTQLDANSGTPVQLTVSLQGVTDQQLHDVRVNLDGLDLGDVKFEGMVLAAQSFAVPSGLVHDGANVLTLTPEAGDSDVTVVDYVDVTYPRLLVANADRLEFTVAAMNSVKVTGFSNSQIRVIDITKPSAPAELVGQVQAVNGGYEVTFRVPGMPGEMRKFLAFAPSAVPQPAAIVASTPSSWFRDSGRKIVMISHPDFIPALTPLVNLRESQGNTVGVVDVDSVYDEFGYGEHGADAIKQFLSYAEQHWQTKPQDILLVGGASLDPRNRLGFGDLDFVPTELVPTQELMTSSDGAFVDFKNTGVESIPIGRLPVRTLADAENVVNKIVSYETSAAAPWQQRVLFVAGHDTQQPFELLNKAAEVAVPANLSVTTILLQNIDAGTARSMLFSDWQQGQLVINYMGHGSESLWDNDLLTGADASTLGNGNQLPFVITLDCLNGFFQDVYGTSLAQSLLLAQNGGAVGVLASSSLTNAGPQGALDQAMLQNLFGGPNVTLGAALQKAKQNVADPDVRRSFMLFGDPAMRLK